MEMFTKAFIIAFVGCFIAGCVWLPILIAEMSKLTEQMFLCNECYAGLYHSYNHIAHLCQAYILVSLFQDKERLSARLAVLPKKRNFF